MLLHACGTQEQLESVIADIGLHFLLHNNPEPPHQGLQRLGPTARREDVLRAPHTTEPAHGASLAEV